jgi:hypothetical protein
LTRFLMVIYFEILGIKRKNGNPNGKICLNHFVTEDSLTFVTTDYYTALELKNMIPVVDRGNYYKKIVKKNLWINKKFLFSPWDFDFLKFISKHKLNYWLKRKDWKYLVKENIFLDNFFDFPLFSFVEKLLAKLQIDRIEEKRKKEKGGQVL